jgi:hypothetical protein
MYEVFGDGNLWMLGEAAEIRQFPSVPEPACLGLGAVGAALVGRRRARC